MHFGVKPVEKLRAVFGQSRDEGSENTIIEGRVPPHDLDAEAAVLSAVMNDKLSFDKVAEFLRPEHFYSCLLYTSDAADE